MIQELPREFIVSQLKIDSYLEPGSLLLCSQAPVCWFVLSQIYNSYLTPKTIVFFFFLSRKKYQKPFFKAYIKRRLFLITAQNFC